MTRVNPVHDDMNQTQIRPAATITEPDKAAEVVRRRNAVLCVGTNAVDADDFLLLLALLGLEPREGRTP